MPNMKASLTVTVTFTGEDDFESYQRMVDIGKDLKRHLEEDQEVKVTGFHTNRPRNKDVEDAEYARWTAAGGPEPEPESEKKPGFTGMLEITCQIPDAADDLEAHQLLLNTARQVRSGGFRTPDGVVVESVDPQYVVANQR
jgi:hypothetical protein